MHTASPNQLGTAAPPPTTSTCEGLCRVRKRVHSTQVGCRSGSSRRSPRRQLSRGLPWTIRLPRPLLRPLPAQGWPRSLPGGPPRLSLPLGPPPLGLSALASGLPRLPRPLVRLLPIQGWPRSPPEGPSRPSLPRGPPPLGLSAPASGHLQRRRRLWGPPPQGPPAPASGHLPPRRLLWRPPPQGPPAPALGHLPNRLPPSGEHLLCATRRPRWGPATRPPEFTLHLCILSGESGLLMRHLLNVGQMLHCVYLGCQAVLCSLLLPTFLHAPCHPGESFTFVMA